MSDSIIGDALLRLGSEISNCEKAVIEFIRKKKMPASTAVENRQVNFRLQETPIAIIGMASIFPQARTLQEFWENIIHKIDCITDVPASRWNINHYYDDNPRAKDKTYCKRGGFIPDIDFDPMEFGIPPKILEVTDVSQLLGLLVAKEAMTDAGYGESRQFNRERTGVVLGVALARQLSMPLSARLQYPVWEKVLKSSGLSDSDTQKIIEKIKSAYIEWEENAFPGMLANVISGRIANRLDLGGMNCVVDAACASSLGALTMAISELVEYRADMMLTGGVDTDNSAMAYLCFSKTPAVSPGANVKAFDADADGMMLGEGVGMLLLKRLADAERDDDRIYAVIKGIGTASDGRYKSIYAPRPAGQVRALRRAYVDAGVAPNTIGLIEAHGTGTLAGDLAELTSLKEVFEAESASPRVALGSVKSQIGHTKAAAGAASLIKTALALHHKVLPPTININQPHPKLTTDASALYLNTATRPWIQAEGSPPRRAGVSSFGFGGTNYHVVLEEYQREQHHSYRLHRAAQPVLLSAVTPEELLVQCRQHLDQLQSHRGRVHFQSLTRNSSGGIIPETDARLGFMAQSLEEAQSLLQIAIDCLRHQLQVEVWEHPRGIYYRRTAMETQGKVVALFSGQGCQYLEMGRELTNNFPELRQLYSDMDHLLQQDGLEPISKVVFPPPALAPEAKQHQVELLQRTDYAQPAIAVFSVGLYQLLQRANFRPDFVAGHSFGELTALWAAGVFGLEDYFQLVKARGQAMAASATTDGDPGSMLAVKGEVSQVESLIQSWSGVAIANRNSPYQVVLAGPRSAIQQAEVDLSQRGYKTVLLPVAAAFHTSRVGHAQTQLARSFAQMTFNQPKIPVYSNVTGQPYAAEPVAIQQLLTQHLTRSVHFQQEIENIYAQGGQIFVEFGPRRVLANLVAEILGDRPHLAVALNASSQKDSDLQLRTAILQLRVAGLPLHQHDPYQYEPPPLPERKNSKLCVRLNGGNYVSEKTRQAFEQALQDGHRINLVVSEAAPHPPQTVGPELLPIISVKTKPTSNGTGMGASTGNGHSNSHSNGHSNGHGPQPQVLVPAMVYANEFSTASASSSNLRPDVVKTPQPVPMSANQPQSAIPEVLMNDSLNHLLNNPQVLQSLEHTIQQFNQQQHQICQVHEQALKQHGEYATVFLQLMQQQRSLAAGMLTNGKPKHPPLQLQEKVLQGSEQSLMQFHAHQSETLRLHEQCLNFQIEQSQLFFQLIQQQYQQFLNGEQVSPPTLKAVQTDCIAAKQTLMASNPVAVPTEGLDRTERVETALVGAGSFPVQLETADQSNGQKYRESSPCSSQALSIAAPEPSSGSNGHNPTSDIPLPSEPVATEPADQVAQVAQLAPVDLNEETLNQILLKIVSEKTGYPVEMLELDMDMEADLGIDSIKRVEILGALQEPYPELPEPDLEQLGELRTLRQVIALMQEQVAQVVSGQIPQPETISDLNPPVTLPEVNQIQTLPVTTELTIAPPETLPHQGMVVDQEQLALSTAQSGSGPVTLNSAGSLQLDEATLSQILLKIVSEKTGYPAEMLELDMNMEADLGIDSIKRVEILGALQELYPELPEPDLEQLGELQTIRQVIGFIQAEATRIKSEGDSSAVDPKSGTVCSQILRLPVDTKFLPPPDFWDFKLPAGYVCLLTDTGSPITSKLAQALIERGWSLVVLNYPASLVGHSSPLPQNLHRVVLADLSLNHLQERLAEITAQFGPIGGLIHLHPCFPTLPTQTIFGSETDAALLKHLFFMAKHLKDALNQAAQQGQSCFLAVTQLDGALGLAGTHDFGPIAGGLFGLTKTLRQEWPGVFCRTIDLHPDLEPEAATTAILAELHDPNRLIGEVGYGPQGRITLVPEPASPVSESSASLPIDTRNVFLVSGGGKGITAACVAKLAEAAPCHFILLGRSAIADPEPAWASGCMDEASLKQRIMENLLHQGEKPTPHKVEQTFKAIAAQREIEQTLAAIRQAGGQAEYLSVDITDLAALQAQLAPVVERYGPITGILHGAGNLADKRIEHKSEPDFARVYDTKVKGLEHLLACVDPGQLQYLVLFSSVAGFYGNVGQADYAIANEILNKSAHRFHQQYPNCRVVAINWGPWDYGMVTPALKKAFAKHQIETIPVAIGAELLVRELTATTQPQVQVMIGNPLTPLPPDPTPERRAYRLHRHLTEAMNPFLQDHKIAGFAVLPATCAFTWMGSACEQLYPGYTFFKCQNFKVLKGIVFDQKVATDYVLDIQEVSKSTEALELEAKIWSQTPEGKSRYHFSFQAQLLRHLPPAPFYEAMDLGVDSIFTKTASAIYHDGPDRLFHGPSFQGVQKVLNLSPEKLTMTCQVARPEAKHQGQFPVQTLNPYIADVESHATWLWLQHFHQQGCLPAEIREFQQFSPAPFDQTIWVSMQVKTRTKTFIVVDIIAHDRQGQVYSQMLDAKVTVLPPNVNVNQF